MVISASKQKKKEGGEERWEGRKEWEEGEEGEEGEGRKGGRERKKWGAPKQNGTSHFGGLCAVPFLHNPHVCSLTEGGTDVHITVESTCPCPCHGMPKWTQSANLPPTPLKK